MVSENPSPYIAHPNKPFAYAKVLDSQERMGNLLIPQEMFTRASRCPFNSSDILMKHMDNPQSVTYSLQLFVILWNKTIFLFPVKSLSVEIFCKGSSS